MPKKKAKSERWQPEGPPPTMIGKVDVADAVAAVSAIMDRLDMTDFNLHFKQEAKDIAADLLLRAGCKRWWK